ncbi:MAG: DUF2244 domain-containing protein [Rhodospirillales bacterium]
MIRSAADPVLYSVVLRPHRSAGRRAIRSVIWLVAIPWLVVGAGFAAAGAWPVLPFLGLEVLLLYGALRLNQKAGNAYEAVNLTERTLSVRRVDHWGRQTHYSFPPQWLQVNIDDPPTPRSPVELRSHGRSLHIGTFLLPHERLELARALRRELFRITRPRRPA